MTIYICGRVVLGFISLVPMDEIIDVVDQQGNSTGETVSKNLAHKEGILHKVAHVHFYDQAGYIYFQKRSATKKHFPGMLHFAIGGHIGTGEDVIDAVIREGQEEIGITVFIDKLELINTYHQKTNHPKFELIDNEIAFDYVYEFDGNIDNLVFEDGEVEGFEKIHVDQLISFSLDQFERKNIVPYGGYSLVFEWIKNKVG